ncbi:MAG: family 16 glycosylhydrolase, partial [Pseudomonadota bacterium]|nr:family 16 glycosylhydrolase [Pseudomonadota bacterium]
PVTRTVTVADTTPPVITLLGDATVEIDLNASYTDAGATAVDAVDGDHIDGDVELIKTGSVDTASEGTYTITYTATDSSDNSASVSRTVGVLGVKTRILNVFTDGEIDPTWNEGFNGADSAIGWSDCSNDGGEGCPNIAWALVNDPDRGQVLQIEHSSAGQQAIFFIKTANPQNLSVYAGGQVKFDIKTISGDSNYTMKIDCVYPCSSGDRSLGVKGQDDWEEVSIEVDDLVDAGLSLVSVNTGIVIWASQYTNTIFQIDNIRWEDTDGGEEPVDPVGGDDGWIIPNYAGHISPSNYDDYELVWADEFDGSEINTDNWSFDVGGWGWGNNERQFHTSRNAYVKDGMLVIRAQEEEYGGNPYTSSRLKTQGKQNFLYGRIDIRARLPEGQGMWPALWMLGSNFSEVSWPKSGEIDIMEMVGGSNREYTVHGTAHWNNGGINADYSPAYYGGSKTKTDGKTLADQFHVFSIVWTRDSIIWYLDDVQYHIMALNNSADLAPFRKEFFFIFNIAVGGNWPGYPDSTTVFPQRMVVDYVRVFQQN